MATIPFMQARYFHKAERESIDLLVIHTAEVGETETSAEALMLACTRETLGRDGKPVLKSWHFCLDPGTRVLTHDLRWAPIATIKSGDRLVGVDEKVVPGQSDRYYRQVVATEVSQRDARRLELRLSDGRSVICSPEHRWLAKPPAASCQWDWRHTIDFEPGWWIRSGLRPWVSADDRSAGYIDGILDGEGSWHSDSYIQFSQKPGLVLDKATGILREWGVPFTVHHRPESGVSVVSMTTFQSTAEVLGRARPVRLMKRLDDIYGRAIRSRTNATRVQIDEVVDLGTGPVVSLETDEHTFIAEGLISHNSVDSNSVTQSVLVKDVAWHAPGANNNGVGIELATRASNTADQWASPYCSALLNQAAQLCRALCERYAIPVAFVDAAGLMAGQRGITTHAAVTAAFKKGDHTDPGAAFPMATFLALIAGAGAPTS